MPFDRAGAKAAGWSDQEIDQYLASRSVSASEAPVTGYPPGTPLELQGQPFEGPSQAIEANPLFNPLELPIQAKGVVASARALGKLASAGSKLVGRKLFGGPNFDRFLKELFEQVPKPKGKALVRPHLRRLPARRATPAEMKPIRGGAEAQAFRRGGMKAVEVQRAKPVSAQPTTNVPRETTTPTPLKPAVKPKAPRRHKALLEKAGTPAPAGGLEALLRKTGEMQSQGATLEDLAEAMRLLRSQRY